MSPTILARAPQIAAVERPAVTQACAGAIALQGRFRVDGKFLSRGQQRVRLRGVTYGPFRPNAEGHQFPAENTVRNDFSQMNGMGINAIRTYHVPPDNVFAAAVEHGLGILVDVPWSKHLCFLDSTGAQSEARRAVRQAAAQGARHNSLLAYSIGNEIPPDVVRWHGAARVERFLRELVDVAHQADPAGLVTYGNYPPTEYLDLRFLDFATFNVYLHDSETFRRYLLRLQNWVGDRPLVLGEIGMDTLRNGEMQQADFLAGHTSVATRVGLAGTFVFSWTDEWFTGQQSIEDWAFGITHADRTPKVSYFALKEAFHARPVDLLPRTPRVSVVVCSYNGGRTLEHCIQSLLDIDYPNYEVIVVDDGSTDETGAILARYPQLTAIHQKNLGLGEARNVGLRAATGDVIAYTDSDCVVDRDWLTYAVAVLEQSDAAAVGGPNLTPNDGRIAACVDAAPGQPTHVLESDQVAEHIPGCNMFFRRTALEAINGFDPQFRKAGDDVDVCWRLQQAGYWITFASSAFVWHHRRPRPRAYLKQQIGYGEAEALLHFKHPERFNSRGQGKWRGELYGDSLRGLVLSEPIIYHGPFCTGPFQCIYTSGPSHWAMIPSTLEWHAYACVVLLLGIFWWPCLLAAAGMFALSLLVAVMQAAQAVVPTQYDGWSSRVLVAALCYAQPLVRTWARFRTRYLLPVPHPLAIGGRMPGRSRAPRQVAYWGAGCPERTELLRRVIAQLEERLYGKKIDSGWSDCDLEVFADPGVTVRICTAQEELGGGERMLRLRYLLRVTSFARVVFGTAAVVATALFSVNGWAALSLWGSLLVIMLIAWRRGVRLWARIASLFDDMATDMALIRVEARSNVASPSNQSDADGDRKERHA